jgi:hypothetical protein
LTGTNELSAAPENIAAAVTEFVRPDVNAPSKAVTSPSASSGVRVHRVRVT